MRGDYKPAPVALKLTAEDFAKLKGKWGGTVSITNAQNGQTVELPIVLRFESNTGGEYFGYVDSPKQNAMGLIISFASVEADKVTIRSQVIQSEYVGTLGDGKVTGDWTQGGQRMPLELTRAP